MNHSKLEYGTTSGTWSPRAILVYAIIFLFFLELLTDFIAGIYGFGVMGTGLPIELAALVLFLSPFFLLLFKRGLPTTGLIVLGELVLLCRAVEILLPTRGQLLVAGLGTGLFLFLFPALLWNCGQKRDYSAGPVMAAALVLAIAVSVLLSSLGSTMDLSNEGWFEVIAWILAIGAGILLPGVFHFAPNQREVDELAEQQTGWWKIMLLSIGLVAVFTLLYFAFTSPTVISSWTRVNYLLILTLAILTLVAFTWMMVCGRQTFKMASRNGALILTVVFVLAMTVTLIVNQVPLPKTAASYPLREPSLSPFWIISLLAMLLLYPVLFLDFRLLVEEMVLSRPTSRKVGLGFGLASLFMMLLALGHVFTSVWAYIDPIIEPFFRNRFWHIHFTVGLILAFSMLAVSKKAMIFGAEPTGQRIGRGYVGLVTALGVIALLGAFLLAPNPERTDTLKVAGYNIQQGYDINGQRGHEAQCEVLKEIDADVVGLSENDTTRIAGGNFDIVRYLADCLNMYSYGGPRTAAGTFGYALLSKYAIENAETIHLFSGPGLQSVRESAHSAHLSVGDQVAIIQAQINVDDKQFNIFVNHFDSYPPMEQPEGFIETAKGLDNLIAIGDYNCEPGTECFDIITELLDHCVVKGDDFGIAEGQVDHIFVSPDLECQNYRYVDSEASDHPVVVAEIEL